jgi:hypothetical protein
VFFDVAGKRDRVVDAVLSDLLGDFGRIRENLLNHVHVNGDWRGVNKDTSLEQARLADVCRYLQRQEPRVEVEGGVCRGKCVAIAGKGVLTRSK